MAADTKVKSPTPPADTERAEKFVGWFQKNRRPLTIAGFVALVVAGGTWFAVTAKARREAFAGRELADARAAAESGNLPLAASGLSRVIASYGGTAAGQEARLLLGQVRLLQGQAALAVADLQDFVAAGPSERYRAQAYGLLGAGLEQTGQFGSAGQAYEEAARASGYRLEQARQLLNAGRAFTAAADTAAAMRVLDRVVAEQAGSAAAAEAKIRLGELGKYTSG
ncbi:MAG: tetratricopeptide repeat protein [Gemmatimonadota bacterium]|nr:tetratricopeptide repeat protein [Gemmatimonadota bacterium]